MKDRIIGAFRVVLYAAMMVKASGAFYIFLVLYLGLLITEEIMNMANLENFKFPVMATFTLSFVIFTSIEPKILVATLFILSLFSYLVIVENVEKEIFFTITLSSAYVLIGIGSIGLLSKKLLILLISIVWSTDTLAYLTGRFFGKHKLAPTLSPKKTVEGSIGGTIGGTIITLTIANILNIFEINPVNILLILTLTVISQLGDLLESYIKRYFNVKDSGNIIPGHGGIFDRLDSSIAVAPFLLLFIQKSFI